jgi:hypothetical protein
VIIDDSYPEVSATDACRELRSSRAALWELDPITDGDGAADYTGPLLGDLDFGAFSHSALVRIADEVVLQMHLLDLGFVRALRQRAEEEQVREIATKQLTGIAGISAERIHRELGLPGGTVGALRVLELHPLLNPAGYVEAGFGAGTIHVSRSPAHEDGGWISLCGPGALRPLQAIVRAVDPRLDVELEGTGTDWTARIVERNEPAREFDEVAVTRISTGAEFRFEPRLSLPITPV